MSWWRNVLIGSLKFPSWSPMNESLTLQNVIKILHNNPVTYLLVVKSLNPLDVIGVIVCEDIDKMKQGAHEDVLSLPVVQVDGLVKNEFIMLPIENNVIGDVEKALDGGAKAVVLHRTTRELRIEDGNDEMTLVERQHPISVVTRAELNNWIADVEAHHNIV